MRNKGAILTVAILLALVCLYHLSFTFVALKVESDAKEHAMTDTARYDELYKEYIKEKSAEDIWLWRYTYKDCKEQEINLGLDLKGGMNVVLEISVVDVIKSLAGDKGSPVLLKTIARAKELQQNSNDDFVILFGQAFEELQPGGQMAALFQNPDLSVKIPFDTPNDEVLSIISKETSSAISNSFNVLRKRIDKFGVAQPNIQQLESAGRILVELPGIKDQERVRKLLQGTASLEFWETYENTEVYQYLLEANKKIVEMNKDTTAIDTTVQESSESLAALDDSLKIDTTSETDAPSLLSQLQGEDEDTSQSLADQLASDTSALTDDQSLLNREKDFPLFTLLNPYVSQEGNLLKGATVGFCNAEDTSKVNEYLNMRQIKSVFPRNLVFCWSVKPFNKSEYYELVALKTSRGDKPALSGDVIIDARQAISQTGGSAEVSMQMNNEGAKIWKLLTKEAAGVPDDQGADNKQIAVVLDGYVYSHPVVNGEIPNGSSQISGGFTVEEAKDLADVIKSGKMPAPATIISEEIVGPSLGKENIRAGLLSFIIAFLVVLAYMMFYYSRAGVVADIALLANVFFILGVLASLGAVLTLPGIAGIVLTIGMSVDANVLIYERIKEEVRAGKGLKLALSDGYKNAYSAIIDANVTTLLTGVVLYTFGTGPIQGFATTLIIGILTSLFSAIFITRLIFMRAINKNNNISFSSRFTENAFQKTKIKFLEKRKVFYIVSAILIVSAIISLATRGLNAGVDFTGGRSFIVQFDEDVSTSDIQGKLKTAFEGMTPEVKTFGAANKVKITTKYLINLESEDADSLVESKLFDGLKPIIGDNVNLTTFLDDYRLKSYKVGPTIVDEMIWKAVWAIVLSLVIIFLYILIRFKNWQFGLGALAALVHDVLIILGLFSIFYSILPFSLEIDQAFIAALLTVVGYSINDTVVVFDRIREYLGLYKKRERTEIMNTALNSTLSRTVSTSLSTFIVLLTIFIFGGDVIRGFIFALLVGVVVGTYSSLFIATPVIYDTLTQRDETTRVLKGRKKA